MRLLIRSSSTLLFGAAWALAMGAGCGGDDTTTEDQPKDPNTADRVSVDRFSQSAGMLFVRDATNGLPEADEAIDFDQGPFITMGLGPQGQVVRYYNFDVQSTTPAPIYALFKEGESMPVDGQLNIVDVIPGDTGYNDFWQVMKVTVPADYVANTVTSLAEIQSKGFAIESTDILVNCPVVPVGSTAKLRIGGGAATLVNGWYKGKVVSYFSFEEAPLQAAQQMVPLSPIYVEFNVNPDEDGGGPPSGFKTEPNTTQTHNVVATVPADTGYSPLWMVNVVDNADFDQVSDLTSAKAAQVLAEGVATVNCPIVSVQ